MLLQRGRALVYNKLVIKQVIYIAIVVFLLLSLSFPAAAQEMEVSASPSVSPTLASKYQLPYPGLLPDSPLYSLKMLRDRLVSMLISDTAKKAEFNLLQADKRINAGWYLFIQGKYDLALETISKGQNYFEDAIAKMQGAKKEGIDVTVLLKNLPEAGKKHEQLLADMVKQAPKERKQAFTDLYNRTHDLYQQVKNTASKK